MMSYALNNSIQTLTSDEADSVAGGPWIIPLIIYGFKTAKVSSGAYAAAAAIGGGAGAVAAAEAMSADDK
jgi:hypothetical protein